jgi:multiple sugar transport system permease protein
MGVLTNRPVSPGGLIHRGSFGRRLQQLWLHIALVAVCITVVAPFLWLVFGSFKTYEDLVGGSSLLPASWTLDNYREIIDRANFIVAFMNSVATSTIATVSVVIWSTALGFVFAKYRFPGREALFALLLTTLMVPFAIVLIPLYLLMAWFGLVDSLMGVILPTLIMTFGVFVLRQAIEGIPGDYLDAARIDGASEFRIVLHVVVPLAMPAIAAVTVVAFLGTWDNFFWPSQVLNSPSNQTLPLMLAGLRGQGVFQRYDLWLAAAVLTVTPVVLLYAALSRHFIRGVALGGLK